MSNSVKTKGITMRNKIVTILCILAILITMVIAATDGRQTMTFSNSNEWGNPMVGELSDDYTDAVVNGN